MQNKELLHTTQALCPDCLRELPAEVYADDEGIVWMERTCPEHGVLATRMWPDADHYQWLRSRPFEDASPEHHPGYGGLPLRLRDVRPSRAARDAP